MLDIKVHHVTLRLLSLDSPESKEYIKKHALDSNLWEAYFPLSGLSHSGKLRECFELLPHGVVVEMACRFADSVLDLFEKEYPGDKRPRWAIMAARAWIKNPCEATRDAARDAARDADAAYAARAAGDAARDAAWAADAANAAANAAYAANASNAAWAAAWAADAAWAAGDAAAYAARAAAYAAYADPSQEGKQVGIVLDVIRGQSILLNQTSTASL